LAGIVDPLEVFLESASSAQAALFTAACAERVAGILFWVVSREGRHDDLGAYASTLDLLWDPDITRSADGALTSNAVETMRELALGDAAIGSAAAALPGAVAIRSALLYRETGDMEWVRDCSKVLEGHAFRLGRRASRPLLDDEHREEAADISAIAGSGDSSSAVGKLLRERARSVARVRLEIAMVAHTNG
jgi:hypothetical protein